MRNILLTNSSLLAKIFLRIYAVLAKVKETRQQSAKQRLRIALAHLENNTGETSLTIINDLQQMIQDYPQYHWIIMAILTSFVQNNSPYLFSEKVTSQSAKVRIDIQAALTVIATRDVNKDPENEQLDLSCTDMRGANLKGANLEQTNLYQVNLCGANLSGANLEGAILSAANLEGANLSQANLHRANLYLARLQGALLNDAILNGTNLREAKFYE